jgi:hypothetical protein
MRIRAGYNRISGTSIRSHRHHETVYTGQNGQYSGHSSPRAAPGEAGEGERAVSGRSESSRP